MNYTADADFRVFTHHIYEYQKGLRSLVLHTMAADMRQAAAYFLEKRKIDYHIQHVTPHKINVFFGDSRCVEIIKSFNIVSLSYLTDEQDFMLGVMLGYDRALQCERYLKRKKSALNATQQTRVTGKIAVAV